MSNYWDYDEPEYEPEPVLELKKELENLQAENKRLQSMLFKAVKIYENGAVSYMSEKEREFQQEVFGEMQEFLDSKGER